MSRGGATLALKITGDARDAQAALGDAGGAVDGFGSKLGKVRGLVGGAFAVGAVVDFGKAAFDAASSLEQSSGAIETIFGSGANSMYQWGYDAAEGVGLAESKYYELANVIGSQLGNMGFSGQKLADQTNSLITLGSDLAAQFGGSTADAVEALSSVFKGETDPIERYGVSIKQSDISARLAALGQDKLTGAALKQATAQAALGLVTEQTKNAQGQFAAQGNTAAEVSQKLGAQWENLKASVGGYLLPLFSALGTLMSGPLKDAITQITSGEGPLGAAFDYIGRVVNQLVPIITSLATELGPKLGPIFDQISGVITGFFVPAFDKIVSIIRDYTIPIFKAVLGPVLDGIGKYFHIVSDAVMRNKDTFIGLFDKVKPFLEFLKNDLAPFLGNVLGKAFEVLGTIMGKVVDVIAWILDKAGDVIGVIGKVGSFLFGSGGGGGQAKPVGAGRMLGATSSGSGALFAASSSLGGGAGPSLAGGSLVQAGDTYQITITGALDPVAVADQIARMLDQRARRIGARPAFGGAA